jgi:hypothetical protein
MGQMLQRRLDPTADQGFPIPYYSTAFIALC